MSSQPNNLCEELEPQLAAFALGEAPTTPELLAHLNSCEHCQRRMRGYAQVARVLPYTAPAIEPDAALRVRLLAAVEQQVEPAPQLHAPVKTPPSLPAAPRRRMFSRQLVSWGLAFAALLALLGWNLNLQRQLGEATTQVAASRSGWRSMIVLLNDEQVSRYALSGNNATGHFWTSPVSTAACLVVQGLPVLEAGEVYQVWLERDGQRVAAGTFDVRNGGGWVLVEPGEAPEQYDAVVVTVEPVDAPAANGPVVLRGELVNGQSVGAVDRELAIRWMLDHAER